MKPRLTKKRILIGAVLLSLAAMVGFGAVLGCIEFSLRDACALAQAAHAHRGDDVSALIAFVQASDHSLKDRNRAVWALGRLGDPRALAVLESYRTGQDCNHGQALCQHELEKAIKYCRKPLPSLFAMLRPE